MAEITRMIRLSDEFADSAYWVTSKGYCYMQVLTKCDNKLSKIRRISSETFLNRYEEYYNY